MGFIGDNGVCESRAAGTLDGNSARNGVKTCYTSIEDSHAFSFCSSLADFAPCSSMKCKLWSS